ncbi:hypothetical protein WR25_24054 isoform C [Diploscapter pachys]|uniref:JmjC domain-containing protein n=1 Tax=Diploscapter pachys TaxID=2018661 RepID=A0A2A2LBL2_9BILA|nr:hypothetical protein WR25_24054 isoform C [Diploscapter pachys]
MQMQMPMQNKPIPAMATVTTVLSTSEATALHNLNPTPANTFTPAFDTDPNDPNFVTIQGKRYPINMSLKDIFSPLHPQKARQTKRATAGGPSWGSPGAKKRSIEQTSIYAASNSAVTTSSSIPDQRIQQDSMSQPKTFSSPHVAQYNMVLGSGEGMNTLAPSASTRQIQQVSQVTQPAISNTFSSYSAIPQAPQIHIPQPATSIVPGIPGIPPVSPSYQPYHPAPINTITPTIPFPPQVQIPQPASHATSAIPPVYQLPHPEAARISTKIPQNKHAPQAFKPAADVSAPPAVSTVCTPSTIPSIIQPLPGISTIPTSTSTLAIPISTPTTSVSEELTVKTDTEMDGAELPSAASSSNECSVCKANKLKQEFFIFTGRIRFCNSRAEEEEGQTQSFGALDLVDVGRDEKDSSFYSWVQCDACKDWMHKVCVDFRDYEEDLIDKYFCPKCREQGHEVVYRPILLDHRYDFWDTKQTNSRPEIGTKAWIDEFVSKEATIPPPDDSECQLFENGNEFMDFFYSELRSRNWDKVYLVKKSEGLQIRMPDDPNFNIDDVANIFGEDYRVDTIDVYRQATYSMKLGDFRQKLHSQDRSRLYNFLSLEFSENPTMKQHVAPPIIVNQISFVHKLWPEVDDFVNYESLVSDPDHRNSLTPEQKADKPNVALFCLSGMAGSFTDCHIDFGGSSVWYHIWKGQKIFYIAPPTPSNLRIYEAHQTAKDKAERFLMDEMDFKRVVIPEGATLMIPSGWIHCVYTPCDSLVFGGNYLHMLNVPMQLKVYEMEERIKESTKLDSKFFFPNFELVNWYAARSLVFDALKEANDEGNVAEPAVLAAAKALLPRLIKWTKRDRAAGLLDSSDTGSEDVISRIDKELQKQNKLVHESSPDRSTKKKRKRTSASKRNSAGQDNPNLISPSSMSNSQLKSDETNAELTGDGETTALKIRIPRASVNVDTSPPISRGKFSLERAGEIYQSNLDAGEPVIHEAVNMFARKSSSGRQRKPAKWLEAFAGEQIEKEAIKLEEAGNQPTSRPLPVLDAAMAKIYKEEQMEENKAKRKTQKKTSTVRKVAATGVEKKVAISPSTNKTIRNRLAKKLKLNWDKCYENELKNFEESGQEGEIWFGKRTEKRIVDFITDSKTLSDCQIIDVGCGNGSLLRSLRSKGYRNLTGIDCCDAAVKLADAIARQGRKSDQADISFAVLSHWKRKIKKSKFSDS